MTTQHVVDPIAQPTKQKVKVMTVVCRQIVQEAADLILAAPPGIIFHHKTGTLKQRVSAEPNGAPQIRTTTLLPNNVIIQGVVPIRLIANDQVVIPLLEIPFQSMVACPGAEVTDITQIHDFQVLGFSICPVRLPDICGSLCALKTHLVIKTVIRACIVVGRESLLRVDATRPFC